MVRISPIRRCSPTRTTSAMLASSIPVATTSGPETLTIFPIGCHTFFLGKFLGSASKVPFGKGAVSRRLTEDCVRKVNIWSTQGFAALSLIRTFRLRRNTTLPPVHTLGHLLCKRRLWSTSYKISAPTALSTAVLTLAIPMPSDPSLPGIRMIAGVRASLYRATS